MKKLFESPGNLYFVEDIHGKPVSEAMANIPARVHAVVSYELKPHPQSPLRVDLYGPGLMRLGQTKDRLVLDNGVCLTGRAYGGKSRPGDRRRINRIEFFDIQEPALVIGADNRPVPQKRRSIRLSRWTGSSWALSPVRRWAGIPCQTAVSAPGFRSPSLPTAIE